jgi:methylmalonyl-CoA mutase cobalamin-binding subunit
LPSTKTGVDSCVENCIEFDSENNCAVTGGVISENNKSNIKVEKIILLGFL